MKTVNTEDAGVYQCHAVNIVNRTVAIAMVRVRRGELSSLLLSLVFFLIVGWELTAKNIM